MHVQETSLADLFRYWWDWRTALGLGHLFASCLDPLLFLHLEGCQVHWEGELNIMGLNIHLKKRESFTHINKKGNFSCSVVLHSKDNGKPMPVCEQRWALMLLFNCDFSGCLFYCNLPVCYATDSADQRDYFARGITWNTVLSLPWLGTSCRPTGTQLHSDCTACCEVV